MTLIPEADKWYLENKYHLVDQPFDGFDRMSYHGVDYDHATGLSDEEIDAGLKKLSEELSGQPHPVFKARMVEYVLDHTRIDVNEHDFFVGIYTWNRPISKYTVHPWKREATEEFVKESERLRLSEAAGGSIGWPDFDHTVPDWDSLMRLGFKGILERALESEKRLEARGELTEKQRIFCEGIEIEYRAVLRLLDRFCRYADTKSFEKAERIRTCMEHLRDGAPKDIYDAMQMIYLYFMISESIEHYQVRSLGYGLDGTLFPYYQDAVEKGTYTRDEIQTLLAYFLVQWSAIGNYWGQPFYMAGTNADGTTKVNELSYIILDVYDRLGIYNPKIQIKVGSATPKDFLCKALNMIRGGNSSIVFCSERHIVQSLMAHGTVTYEQAVDSVISGCYEYKVKAKDIGMSIQYPNLLKPVSLVFDNGFDTVTGQQYGIETGDVTGFTTFDEFYNAYVRQLKHMMIADITALDKLTTNIHQINPSLLFSATIPDCAQTLTDSLDCGLKNGSDLVVGGIGSAADALMAVYELVFEKKVTTLAEMKKALDANWVGYERLRAMALKCRHKYGNADPLTDSYAKAILRLICVDIAGGRINSHGSAFSVEAHSARAFIINGKNTKATPDGRSYGEETSKNASPAPGADRNGITALIRSVTSLDVDLCTTGFCMDAMLHPSAVQGVEGLEAMYGVLKAYMDSGGASIHFNIFNADILRDAQAHPEKYKGLQVRVCGWNVLWNDLPKSEQDAYIARADAIQ